MPEEEDDDEKKGKDKKGGKDDKKDDKKDKKGGKDDKKDKDKGGKDKGGKEKSPKSPKTPKSAGKGSAKGSVKGSPKSDKCVEESSDKKTEKSERSDKSEKSERAERPDRPREKHQRPALGPYKAPPPSETMLRAMAEPGPVYAERFYNDEYEDEQQGRNYVEVQMYQRRSGTNISEAEGGGHCMGGGARGQTFYVDVPPPRPPRPPAFDEYYVDEQPPPPPPRRERSERLERRPSMTQQSVFYDESGGTLLRQRQDAYFDYPEPVGPAGSVPRLEPPPQSRRPIVLPPTTVVVNLSESGAPPPPAVGPPAQPGGYERQLATGASMRSREEFRNQQSDMRVRNAPMSTQLTQQLRDIAMQYQRPFDENVVSSTERVIYEVIRKMESTSSETSEERPPGTIVRNQAAGGMSPMSPPQRPAMSPPQRPAASPPGMMSPGMIRGPPMGMIRSPISAGPSRGYLVRTPSGPLRMATPGTPGMYTPRWTSSYWGTPRTPRTPRTPGGRSRRRNDGMTLFPERSLIMLLVFLFLFVLVVVILAISGMTFPGFSKSKDRYA